MKANNKLSAYRYTAIIRLRGQHQPGEEQHPEGEGLDIGDGEWVDFMD